MISKLKEKIKKLPHTPGVYLFKDKNENIIYIGKAKDLKKRVSSHFGKKEKWTWDFVKNISDLEIIECETEKEAMLIEIELIKKYQPKYNIEWKDDKSYFLVGITKETFPRVFWAHQKENSSQKEIDYFGPFIKGSELKKFLAEIRKILPFRTCKILPKVHCLYYHLKLCLGPCKNKRQVKKYQKMIETLKTLLKIYLQKNLRIEGYDISNISGKLACGSMIVFEKGKPKKSDYRKFKIKRTKEKSDISFLREILLRRMKHKEWNLPDLILLDGGKGQLKAARKIEIPVLALAKTKKYSGKLYSIFSRDFVLIDKLPDEIKNLFLQIRDEAHRFAISYHRLRRKKELIKL